MREIKGFQTDPAQPKWTRIGLNFTEEDLVVFGHRRGLGCCLFVNVICIPTSKSPTHLYTHGEKG